MLFQKAIGFGINVKFLGSADGQLVYFCYEKCRTKERVMNFQQSKRLFYLIKAKILFHNNLACSDVMLAEM